jgi:hypothetical protein
LKKIDEWLRNIGKLIEGALKGKSPEPVPVRVPVRRYR